MIFVEIGENGRTLGQLGIEQEDPNTYTVYDVRERTVISSCEQLGEITHAGHVGKDALVNRAFEKFGSEIIDE